MSTIQANVQFASKECLSLRIKSPTRLDELTVTGSGVTVDIGPALSCGSPRREGAYCHSTPCGQLSALLYPGLRETQQLSDTAVCTWGKFLFLQVSEGESLLLIINHDYLHKASPH